MARQLPGPIERVRIRVQTEKHRQQEREIDRERQARQKREESEERNERERQRHKSSGPHGTHGAVGPPRGLTCWPVQVFEFKVRVCCWHCGGVEIH